MSQTPIIYEARVYSKRIAYKNFIGEVSEVDLHFSLDPLQLMEIIASFSGKPSRSGNPAKAGQPEITDEMQLKFIRDIAAKAAGLPSPSGESWFPTPDFSDSLAGKAFLTQLSSSDGDRRDFAERVILQPFRDFVGYASADPSNSPKDVAQFQKMLQQMQNIFKTPENAAPESVEEKRARLQKELETLASTDE